MELTIYTGYKRMEKSTTPTWDEIIDGALVLYTNGYLESIVGHVRFFAKNPDGSDEWTAGSSDNVTRYVECWFKRVAPITT